MDKVFVSRPLLHNVPKNVLYFCLPFTGTHSLQIHTHILSLVRPPFSTSTFISSFVQPSVFSTFSPLRNRIPKGLRTHVVYSFTCQSCTALCVGQTVRHLHTRVSAFTGKKLHRLALCHILPKLATLHLLTISKFFLLAIQFLNFW